MTLTQQKPAKPKFNVANFVRETRNEIAKITWPTRRDTLMTTVMIIVMALIAGAFFLAIDTGWAMSSAVFSG